MGKKELGKTIRMLRKSRKMTQLELANLLNQSPSSITMYETGRRTPEFETLEAIADIFNVPFVMLDDSKVRPNQKINQDEMIQTQSKNIRTLAHVYPEMPAEMKKMVDNFLEGLFQIYDDQFKKGSNEE